MGITIRDHIEQYMKELKKWLEETAGADLEEMGDFFTARIDEYENHMSIWEKAYQRVAELIPSRTEDSDLYKNMQGTKRWGIVYFGGLHSML